jgi:hypothetical protein
MKGWILGRKEISGTGGYSMYGDHKTPYRSPLLQDEMFEEPNPGLGVHSADLLKRRRFIFRSLSTLCGTVRGQQLRRVVSRISLGASTKNAGI